MHYTYVFSAGESQAVKVGSTNRPKARLYQLRWGSEAPHAADRRGNGKYACVVGFEDRLDALKCERLCQQKLANFRVERLKRNPKSRAGGNPEWFSCSPDKAVKTLLKSAKIIDREKVIMNFLDTPLFWP